MAPCVQGTLRRSKYRLTAALPDDDRALNAVRGGGPLELASPQQVVHVRQHLAERKAHLVRIEPPREHERNKLRGRSRLRADVSRDFAGSVPLVSNVRTVYHAEGTQVLYECPMSAYSSAFG